MCGSRHPRCRSRTLTIAICPATTNPREASSRPLVGPPKVDEVYIGAIRRNKFGSETLKGARGTAGMKHDDTNAVT